MHCKPWRVPKPEVVRFVNIWMKEGPEAVLLYSLIGPDVGDGKRERVVVDFVEVVEAEVEEEGSCVEVGKGEENRVVALGEGFENGVGEGDGEGTVDTAVGLG